MTDAIIEKLKAVKNRQDAAKVYEEAFHRATVGQVDWEKLNTYILERWSMSGLKYIKDLAWKKTAEREGAK
jgi:hypothetical protein